MIMIVALTCVFIDIQSASTTLGSPIYLDPHVRNARDRYSLHTVIVANLLTVVPSIKLGC